MRRKCLYCEKSFNNPLTRDHVVPLSRRSIMSITVPVCRTCNQFKGGDMPLVFIGRMETILKNFKNVLNSAKESLTI